MPGHGLTNVRFGTILLFTINNSNANHGLKLANWTLAAYDQQNGFAIPWIATLRGPCIVLCGGLRTSEREFLV
jgi:hypothetical protein